eukprot:gene12586-26503_t
MWEFSCPTHFVDIRSEREYEGLGLEIDQWFLKNHQLHDGLTLLGESACQKISEGRKKGQASPSSEMTRDDVYNLAVREKLSISAKSCKSSSIDMDISTAQHRKQARTLNQRPSITRNCKNDDLNMRDKLDNFKSNKRKALGVIGRTKSVILQPRVQSKSTEITETINSNKKTVTNNAQKIDKDMMEILKKHNQKFVKTTDYEPSRHAARDVRTWEKETGKDWASLKSREREVANIEISKLKRREQRYF